jgi:hypothetical protein
MAIEIALSPPLLAIADEVPDQTTPGAPGPRLEWQHDHRWPAWVMVMPNNQTANEPMKLSGRTDQGGTTR